MKICVTVFLAALLCAGLSSCGSAYQCPTYASAKTAVVIKRSIANAQRGK